MENSFFAQYKLLFNYQFPKKQFLKNKVLKTKHPVAFLKNREHKISNGSKLVDTFG